MRTKLDLSASKRGDTFIEVMFAIAIFSLVAVLTISLMNLGTASAEGALELTTVRHELNAQAEALRFVHSAYTAERSLPSCSKITNNGEKCRQYEALWGKITEQASRPLTGDSVAQNDLINATNTLTGGGDPLAYKGASGCERAYEKGVFDGKSLLEENKAFILNVRDLNISPESDYLEPGDTSVASRALITVAENDDKFTAAPISARIIYANKNNFSETTADGYAVRNTYNQVSKVEGMWVFAIEGEADAGAAPPFYDFYIQTCWNTPNSLAPTILDTVIRLYNPGAQS